MEVEAKPLKVEQAQTCSPSKQACTCTLEILKEEVVPIPSALERLCKGVACLGNLSSSREKVAPA